MLITLSIEIIYLSSAFYEFLDGGYVSLAVAAVIVAIMYAWNDVYRKKYCYEMDRKLSPEQFSFWSPSNHCPQTRYGYKDVGSQEQQQEPFEGMLVGKLKEFIMNELESELNNSEEEIVEAKDNDMIAIKWEANGSGRRGVEGELKCLMKHVVPGWCT
ncbi:hypothetical protein Ancab_037028 [Ancistrocladus abbreviatus]